MGNGGNDGDDDGAFARALEGALAQESPPPKPSEPEDGTPLLVVIAGPAAGRKLVLRGTEPLFLGRAADCDLQILDDPGVGRRHVSLRPVDDTWSAEDLRSSQGTFINGQRIRRHVLARGDKLLIGTSTIIAVRTIADGDAIPEPCDALTGLLQKKPFADRLKAAFQHAVAMNEPLSVGLLNIDWFMRFNDEHGHLAGDAMLKMIAYALRSSVPATALVGRYGGDAFGVVLPGCELPRARRVLEAARALVSMRGIEYGGARLSVTMSCGVACVPHAAIATPTAKALVVRADEQLSEAKQHGRNCTRPML